MQDGRYEPDSESALTGVRVVDMTRLAAGNMLTRMLVDFGKEDIKIERPEIGDDLRGFGEGHHQYFFNVELFFKQQTQVQTRYIESFTRARASLNKVPPF